MSHRVVQFDSRVVDVATADNLQTEVISHLDSSNYDLKNREVNDGENLNGEVTLGIKTNHNNDSEANSFFDWIKNFVKNNQSSFDSARIRIHDCQHLEGLDSPCQVGNAWEL